MDAVGILLSVLVPVAVYLLTSLWYYRRTLSISLRLIFGFAWALWAVRKDIESRMRSQNEAPTCSIDITWDKEPEAPRPWTDDLCDHLEKAYDA